MKSVAASLLLLSTLAGCHRAAAPAPTCPEPLTAATQPEDARPHRQPLVRLSEHGTWGQALQHTEVPEFTLYDDGLVVFARGVGEEAVAMQARLSKEDTYALLDRVDAALGDLDENIELTTSTDAARASIGVTHNGRIYAVGVYGFGSSDSEAPAKFSEMRDLLQAWDHPDAEPWTPDELEIVLYRKEGAKSSARAWPQTLPPPPSDAREPRARPLGGRSKTMIQQAIRYRVSGALEPALARSLPSAEDGETVAWNDTAWLVRYERVVPARTYYW